MAGLGRFGRHSSDDVRVSSTDPCHVGILNSLRRFGCEALDESVMREKAVKLRTASVRDPLAACETGI